MNSLKILIVEDEILVARDLENMLSDWGYVNIKHCKNSDEVIDTFKYFTPDLMLIDIHLNSVLTGIDVARFVKNNKKNLPIIFLTAQADPATVEKAKEVSPSGYLLKPFDERHLQISIDIAINNFFGSESHKNNKNFINSNSGIKLLSDVILKNGDMLFIKQNYRFVRFQIDELIYLEADKNYTNLVFKNQKVALRLPLQTIFERLQECNNIVRINRSIAINLSFVEGFTETEVIISKNKSFPITASFREYFLEKFLVL